MRHVLFLSLQYVAFHRWKTALLASSLTLTIWLPFAAHLMTARMQAGMTARAKATPLVVGPRGSRIDLALHAMYFQRQAPGTIPMSETGRMAATGLAHPVPLHVRFTAGGFPLAGTTLDYFSRRGLALRSGRFPVRIGDCVLGSAAAEKLKLGPGSRLLSDATGAPGAAGSRRIDMRVTGVLSESRSADDDAVFADVKTAWLVEGLAHGHDDLAGGLHPEMVQERTDRGIVASAALQIHAAVTDENLSGFHFHGDPNGFPLTAILAWPREKKSATILRGKYLGQDDRAQILVPEAVVAELEEVVFKITRLFDAYFGFVLAADLLFISLIVLLSLHLRRGERATMFNLGCRRSTVFWLQAGELGIILGLSLVLSAALAGLALTFAGGIAEQWLA